MKPQESPGIPESLKTELVEIENALKALEKILSGDALQTAQKPLLDKRAALLSKLGISPNDLRGLQVQAGDHSPVNLTQASGEAQVTIDQSQHYHHEVASPAGTDYGFFKKA